MLIQKIKQVSTLLLLYSFFMYTSIAHADFSVTVNKQVNTEKEQKITAKIDGEQKIIEGLLKATPSLVKENTNVIDITWTAILDPKGRVNVSGLTSSIDLDKKFLSRGTSLLVKGGLPNNLKLKSDEEKDNKKRDIPASTSGGSTSINTGGYTSPITEGLSGTIEKPEYVTTYEGCIQMYNQAEETIHGFQQIYYIDNDGTKKVTQSCTKVKDFPAERKNCDVYHDWDNHVSYKRYQPFFTENNKTYGAGGCVPSAQMAHQIDFDVCEAQAIGDTFIKRGQWYYSEDNGEKNYISPCVLDPEGKSESLKVKFEGCPVTHDIVNNQSTHFGKYYWVREDNTVEYLGDCVLTKESNFKHFIEWENEKWKHNNDDWISQRILTRVIYIPQENNRRIVIDNNELDSVKYPQKNIQDGWSHKDDLGKGGGNGHSLRTMKRAVVFGEVNYFTGLVYNEGAVNHVYKGTHLIKKHGGNCGTTLNKKIRRDYQDEIGRPDDTSYRTKTYSICS